MNKEQGNMNDTALEVQRYIMGLMTPDEEVAFEHSAAKSEEIRQELEKSGNGLTTLYDNLSKDMPRPRKDLKHKIIGKITETSMTDTYKDEESFILRADEAKWIPTNIAGIEFKILFKDDDGRSMLIARLAPGAELPSHHRLGTEECYVLSGDFWADGQKLGAGDFIAGFAGYEPDPVHSEGGCELLLKMPIPPEIIPN
jgi:hypothetical protein